MFKKKKSPLKSSKIVKRKRKMLILKVFLLLIIIGVLIGGSIYLAQLHALKITSVVVKGNVAVDTEDIQNVVQPYLEGSYAWVFPKSNRFLYPGNSIEKDLLSQFKRLQSIDLNVEGNDLVVSVVERKAAYTWCSGNPDTADRECFFMDTSGFIFSQSPVFSGNAYLAFYGLIDKANPVGSSYLNNTKLNDVSVLISFLNNHDIHPEALLAEANGVYNLYLEQGGKIIFKQDQPISLIVSNIDLIIQNTDILAKSASKLEYIDLRFGNKLYYKHVGDNMLQIGN